MAEEWVTEDADGVMPGEPLSEERAESPSGSAARAGHFLDPLYGEIRVAAWAETLLATRPFQRLHGISLSDVPGELLVSRRFPSRFDHALGVYALARLARPRDRTLQVAALAHDLGHGPFSHLSEALMRERLGEDHEQRSARLLLAVRDNLSPAAMKKLAWLDWDEAARLITAEEDSGRGALLNGRLDYDNMDNVARFLVAADLGTPSYDPQRLAKGLRLSAMSSEGTPSVYLSAEVEREAAAWQRDRAAVYTFLREGHENLATHAMLRKAIDLALQVGALPADFLDYTDARALRCLRGSSSVGAARLAGAVWRGERYRCVWELELPVGSVNPAADWLASGRDRLALEERLAAEAALLPHEVVIELIVSSAARALPPVARAGRSTELRWLPPPAPTPAHIHVFAAAHIRRDYARRLCIAAERRFGTRGTIIHSAAG